MCYERRDPEQAKACFERDQRKVEYIEREALILQFNLTAERSGDPACPWDMSAIETEIEAMPAADVAPVVHGRWVGLEYDGYADGCPVYDLWECSECGEEVRGEDVPTTHPWCHGCGARMDGE